MTTSAFDTDAFLNRPKQTSTMATAPLPVPAGDYMMLISKVSARENRDGSRVLDVTMKLDDPTLSDQLGRKEITSRFSAFLEFDAAGNLSNEEGANYKLGQLREAVGQNTNGEWAPSMLLGQACFGRVSHRTDKTSGEIRDEVSRVWARS
jgi:hypothetical protein